MRSLVFFFVHEEQKLLKHLFPLFMRKLKMRDFAETMQYAYFFLHYLSLTIDVRYCITFAVLMCDLPVCSC